eukprot:SAG22_NODE_5_length_41775_cov_111.520971_19_plen_895_part_00
MWLVYIAVAIVTLIPVSLPTRSIIAINSGGGTAVAPDDTVFEQDRYYTGGTATGPAKPPIKINGTDFPSVYETARMTTGDEIWYSLPIPYNVGDSGHGWDFVLTLKFVEPRYNQTGKRQFDINLNGLPVLTGIDIVEEVGKAVAYDEDIEFRVEPMSMLLWVTSVGKMRVRMEQPASFGLTSEIHVGVTPQIGSARLCALQVTQGTLNELMEYRSKSGKGGRGKKKAKKRNPNSSDRDYSEDDGDGGDPDGEDAIDSALSYAAGILCIIIGGSLYGYKKFDGGGGGGGGGGKGPPIAAARQRQELQVDRKKKPARRAPVDGEENLSGSTPPRSSRSESPSPAKLVTPPPKKHVPLSPEEEAEQAAKRAKRKEEKARRTEKDREASRRADQLAIEKEKADRESAKKRNASAVAELEKQLAQAEEEARQARAAEARRQENLAAEQAEKDKAKAAEDAEAVKAAGKKAPAEKAPAAASAAGGGNTKAGSKYTPNGPKRVGGGGSNGQTAPMSKQQQAQRQEHERYAREYQQQQQAKQSKHSNGFGGSKSAQKPIGGVQHVSSNEDLTGGSVPAGGAFGWGVSSGLSSSPPDSDAWGGLAGATSTGSIGSGTDDGDPASNVQQTEDRVQQISRQIAALERVLSVNSGSLSDSMIPGRPDENAGNLSAADNDDEAAELADEAADLLGTDIWAALDDDDEGEGLEPSGGGGGGAGGDQFGRTRSRLSAAWSPRVGEQSDGGAGSPGGGGGGTGPELDDQASMTAWLVENKLNSFSAALRREGFATLRDLLEVELDDEHLDQLGMAGLQVHLRYHQALARLKSDTSSMLSSPGPNGMPRVGSSGSLDGANIGGLDGLGTRLGFSPSSFRLPVGGGRRCFSAGLYGTRPSLADARFSRFGEG